MCCRSTSTEPRNYLEFTWTIYCLFCLNLEFSNLKPREYVLRYNPLRGSSTSPRASSRNLAKLSSPSASIWCEYGPRYLKEGIFRRKILRRATRYFPLLTMPTSIAPIFFRRTHFPFTWLPSSNAHRFSRRLLTHSPCISNLLHQEKILFHIFTYIYLHKYIFFPSFSSPFSLFFFQQSNIPRVNSGIPYGKNGHRL